MSLPYQRPSLQGIAGVDDEPDAHDGLMEQVEEAVADNDFDAAAAVADATPWTWAAETSGAVVRMPEILGDSSPVVEGVVASPDLPAVG